MQYLLLMLRRLNTGASPWVRRRYLLLGLVEGRCKNSSWYTRVGKYGLYRTHNYKYHTYWYVSCCSINTTVCNCVI